MCATHHSDSANDLAHVVGTVLAECVEALPASSPMVTTKPLPRVIVEVALVVVVPLSPEAVAVGRAVAGS
jgi:hypothetical protein